MSGALVRNQASPGGGGAARWIRRIAERCAALRRSLFDAYRPELHYMRGPGPKWQAKQYGRDAASSSGADAVARLRGIENPPVT